MIKLTGDNQALAETENSHNGYSFEVNFHGGECLSASFQIPEQVAQEILGNSGDDSLESEELAAVFDEGGAPGFLRWLAASLEYVYGLPAKVEPEEGNQSLLQEPDMITVEFEGKVHAVHPAFMLERKAMSADAFLNEMLDILSEEYSGRKEYSLWTICSLAVRLHNVFVEGYQETGTLDKGEVKQLSLFPEKESEADPRGYTPMCQDGGIFTRFVTIA
jgi:hypothetical protein